MTGSLTASLWISALTAIAAPLVLVLARRTTLTCWRPSRVETASITVAVGAGMALVVARQTAVGVPLVVLGLAAAVVDAREQRLPDLLTGPLLLAATAAAVIDGAGWLALVSPIIAFLAGVAVQLVNADVLGWGDVKLLPSLAVAAAPHGQVIAALVTAAVLIAVTAAGCWAWRWRGPVPYGPALIISTLAAASG